jgi:hypothetical protein
MTDLSTARSARRLLSALAVTLGLAPGAAPAETPRSVPRHAAPQAWLDYARLVTEQVTARFGGDDPTAMRLRDYLEQLPGAAGPDGITLPIAFWIDGAGAISRIDFPPFVHPQPNDDLKALMLGYRLPEAPPKGMLLPLRLGIQFKPKEGAAQPPEPQPRVSVDRRQARVGTVTVSIGYDPPIAPVEGRASAKGSARA